MDVLAQADMLEADQTPHIWSKPSEKLVLFKKILKRVTIAESFYKSKIKQSIYKYFMLVFANKESFIFFLVLQLLPYIENSKGGQLNHDIKFHVPFLNFFTIADYG